MYKKYYNIEDIEKVMQGLKSSGKKKIHLEQLLEAIGCDNLDVQEFYIKNVKHHIRYEREKR